MYCDNWEIIPMDCKDLLVVKDIDMCKKCKDCDDGICMNIGLCIFDYL